MTKEKNSLTKTEQENVSGGRKVNFFGFNSKTGNYNKCDFCGSYGTMPLLNGQDVCLNCLEKMKQAVGQENIIKLIIPQNKPSTPTESQTKNITITTTTPSIKKK